MQGLLTLAWGPLGTDELLSMSLSWALQQGSSLPGSMREVPVAPLPALTPS